MPSIFSRIVLGEVPCHRVAENEEFLAFLDIQPLADGHTLVIPKKEIDYYFDLDAGELARLNGFAQEVARCIEAVIPCRRIGVAVIGLEVPHAHMHLIPLQSVSDINFERPKLERTNEQLAATASSIRDAITNHS